MAAIKSNNTKPEIQVRKFLHANGYRYRLHDNKFQLTNENPANGIKNFNALPILKDYIEYP